MQHDLIEERQWEETNLGASFMFMACRRKINRVGFSPKLGIFAQKGY